MRFVGKLSISMVWILLITPSAFAENVKLIDTLPVTLAHASISQPLINSILEKVEVKSITYLSDNLKIKGYMAVPKKGENLPCVIFNRGGNGDFSALDDQRATIVLGRIASWGYVAVASQYRGNGGGEGREEFGGADVNDVLNLIPILETIPQADTSRIGMWGFSRGGMMTYIALTMTDRIAGAIISDGMADSFDTIKRRPEMEEVYKEWVPDYGKNKETTLAARSAIRWTEKLCQKTPILLLHGGADWRVHPSQAFSMATALYENKHPFRFVFFEGGDHSLSEHREEVNRLTKDWLDHYVRDRRPWPSLEPHGQ